MKKRIDLIILKNTEYIKKRQELLKENIGSIYIKVDLNTLSETRIKLIEDKFTTRLFVANINNINEFYIYGKKKGNKGTFNEHCKNTYYEYTNFEDFIIHIINVSSNIKEKVSTDDKLIKKIIKKLKRELINE